MLLSHLLADHTKAVSPHAPAHESRCQYEITTVAGYFAACVISMAVATPIFTKLADRATSRKMVMVPGMLGSALMAATQPYCDTSTQFLCVGVVGALANALVMPTVAAFIMDNSAQEDRAQALALRCVPP